MVRPRSCQIIYYFDTPALGIKHQSFDHVREEEDHQVSFQSSFLCWVMSSKLFKQVWVERNRFNALFLDFFELGFLGENLGKKSEIDTL